MIYKYLVTRNKVPSYNKRKTIDSYFNKIIDSLNQNEKVLKYFKEAIDILESSELNFDLTNRKQHELKSTIDEILVFIKEKYFRNQVEETEDEIKSITDISNLNDIKNKKIEHKQLNLFEI